MDVRWLQRLASPLVQVARNLDSLVTIQSIENATDALLETERLRGMLLALEESSPRSASPFTPRQYSSDSVRSQAVGTGFPQEVSGSLP